MANSDRFRADSITGVTGEAVTVTCAAGYGGGRAQSATCLVEGTFTTVSCAADACAATEEANSDKSDAGSITGVTGEGVAVACAEGYSGGGTAACLADGSFTRASCAAVQPEPAPAPAPEAVAAPMGGKVGFMPPCLCLF